MMIVILTNQKKEKFKIDNTGKWSREMFTMTGKCLLDTYLIFYWAGIPYDYNAQVIVC